MKKYQSGFSIIELMVGTVISLLVTLTVAGSAQFLDVQKRITVGTNGVLETLAITHREVSNDVKMMGYGVTSCPSVNAVVGGKTIHIGATAIGADIEAPLQLYITDGGDSSSDTLTSFYGESSTGIAYSFLKTKVGNVITTGYAGQINEKGLVLISDATNCDVYAVNGVPSYDVGLNKTTINVNTTFNNKAWTSTTNTYAENSMILGLSDLKLVTHSINNNTLQEFDAITNTTVNVADNVVFYKVFYGLNDSTFVRATGAWSTVSLTANIANQVRIKSIRVFIVARSPVLVSKNKTTGLCDTTEVAPKLFAPFDTTITVDLTGISDWKCYRYKTADFIVPLRNKVLNDGSSGA